MLLVDFRCIVIFLFMVLVQPCVFPCSSLGELSDASRGSATSGSANPVIHTQQTVVVNEGESSGNSSTFVGSPDKAEKYRKIRQLVKKKFGKIRGTYEGGMAWVFRVETKEGKITKIKVPKSDNYHDLVRHEAKAMAAAGQKPPEFVELNGIPMLRTDWVESTLEDTLGTYFGEKAPPIRIADAMENLLDSLSYFHAQNNVHRDIKPENILVQVDRGPDNEISLNLILTDYGLASIDGNLPNGVGGISGTPKYMPAEQARGEAPKPEHDLDTLKKVFVEMALGKRLQDIPSGYIVREKSGGVPILRIAAPLEAIANHEDVQVKVDPAIALLIDYPATSTFEWRSAVGTGITYLLKNDSQGLLEHAGTKWLPRLAKEDPKRAFKLVSSSSKMYKEFEAGNYIPKSDPLYQAILDARPPNTSTRSGGDYNFAIAGDETIDND